MSHRLTPDRPAPARVGSVTGAPFWSWLLARTVLARNEGVLQGAWGRAWPGCTLVVLLRTLADGSAKCAVYPHGLESQLCPQIPHPRCWWRAAGPGQARRRVGVEMTVTASSSDRFRHLALFYHGRGEYLAALSGFIQASRARGDAVFVAVPQHNAQLVRQELGDNSAHVDLVDMAELGRNPARIIPALQAYAGKHNGQHVCCIGEPIWPGRTAAEVQEAIRHEALINLAFRDSLVTVVCPYDSAGLPGSVIADAVRTHPAVIKDRQATASVSYRGPPDVPPRCNRALSRPPVHAETLGYRDDLRPVRSFVSQPGHMCRAHTVAHPRLGARHQRACRQHRAPHGRRRNTAGLADAEESSSARWPTLATSPIRSPGTGPRPMSCWAATASGSSTKCVILSRPEPARRAPPSACTCA